MNQKTQKPFDSIDALICKAEKSLASFLFLLMSLVVFADVLHRVFSRTPGRLASMIAPLIQSTPEAMDPVIDRVVVPVLFFLTAYGAILSRARALKIEIKSLTAAIQAFVGSLGAGLLIIAFIKLIPSGLVWSPYFGLSCLLWLGLLGASIATHQGQHLALEMGEKLWPEKLRPIVSKFASLLVGGFCILIAILAVLSVKDHYVDWSSGPGAGLIPSIEWPKWAVYLVIPYSFFMMGFRFMGRSIGILSDAVKKDEAEHIQEMLATEGESK
jgi:TRAP-type C4-dicarboxylate transport system permease small subunit